MTDESPDVDTDAVVDPLDGEDEDEVDTDAAPATRSEATDELWREVGVDPIKIALPRDQVGYTLRAYRPASQLAPAAASEVEEEDDPFAARERARAEEEAALEAEALAAAEAAEAEAEAAAAEAEAAAADTDAAEADTDEADADVDVDAEDEDEDADEDADEEVPVFLSHRGKLLLFATPELLVSFVGSDASHDMTQLDTWPTLVKRLRAEDVVPTEDDTYELDLVVENLRGGHSVWDVPLLVSAGELARDLGYALRLEPVVTALAPGSPLDDLDDALRATAAGGIGGIFARRRLRRVGAQQASLGWRTIIGKISAAVDWRD